jgi:transposase
VTLGATQGAAHCRHEHEGPPLPSPRWLLRATFPVPTQELAIQEVDEQDLHVERIAALDLGKAALEAWVRVPHEFKPGRRLQEVPGYATTTTALLALADWLHSWGVTRVVMESTSDSWKGACWLLEAEGFAGWLVNAREVKNVPGRPKTDKADAVWLAKVAERGMGRPSLVHPARSANCGT